ncbi:MAG TPA: NAD-dependent deacylase [Calditrichia bacterium]|nr:NAD-dependent deacylase [Calditrichota bacterium]HQU72821.1 NAD-dependent deacylase [Calditrichia bacterium]HQV31625.1 NAD-dependent deacylase [Calditrichia bacterium]
MAFSENFLIRLQKAYSLVILTGAGISAASGIPTFRGNDGLWKKFRAQDLADPRAFAANPNLVWKWYAWRRAIVKKAQPNPAHLALRDIEPYFFEFTIITQNVDDLHQRAGSGNIISLHGNILENKCINCDYRGPESEISAGPEIAPNCPKCGKLIRPGVVWFGESLPITALERAQKAAAEAEMLIAVGTSNMVEPAASLPYLAKGNGAFVMEINPEETPLISAVDEHLPYPAEKVLPVLAKVVAKIRKRKK